MINEIVPDVVRSSLVEAQIKGQTDRRLFQLHRSEHLIDRVFERLIDKATAIDAARDLANPRGFLLDLPFRMLNKVAVPVTTLALFGVGTAGAVSPRLEGDSSAHVFQTGGFSSSWREAFSAHGLDLDVEAQQNIEQNYQFGIYFTDSRSTRRFWGVDNAKFGIPPNDHVGTGTIDNWDLDRMVITNYIQPYRALDPETRVNNDIVEVIEGAAVDPSTGWAYMLKGVSVHGTVTFLQRVEKFSIDNATDYSTHSEINEGLPQGGTNGNRNTLALKTDNLGKYLEATFFDSVNPDEDGIYTRRLDNSGNPTGSFLKMLNITSTVTPTTASTATAIRTETPIPTAISTVTPTRTATSTPRETATPISSARAFGVAEMSSNTILQINWTQRTESIGSIIARISPPPRGLELLPPGGILPPTQTSFTDILPANMTGVVCEALLVLGNSGAVTEVSNAVCDFLGTRAGTAPDNLSLRVDPPSTITLGWSGPGSQTDYLFATTSGTVLVLDRSVTSVTYNSTGTECFMVIPRINEQNIGNSNLVCKVNLIGN